MFQRLEGFLKVKDGKSTKQLPNEFSNLIIGRNSNFNTDELTDEELEKLGGLESVFAILFSLASSYLIVHGNAL